MRIIKWWLSDVNAPFRHLVYIFAVVFGIFIVMSLLEDYYGWFPLKLEEMRC